MVAVLRNKESGDFVETRSNIPKSRWSRVSTNDCCCITVKPTCTIMTELCEGKPFVKNENDNKNKKNNLRLCHMPV